MFLFPWNWDNFFLRCRNNTIYRTTLMDESSNGCNTITSLNQNNLVNVFLYWDKNFDNNNNQSTMGTKPLKRNSCKNFFIILLYIISFYQMHYTIQKISFWAILLTILDNPVYKIFSKTLLFFYSFIICYFCLWGNRKGVFLYCLIWYSYQICFAGSLLLVCF